MHSRRALFAGVFTTMGLVVIALGTSRVLRTAAPPDRGDVLFHAGLLGVAVLVLGALLSLGRGGERAPLAQVRSSLPNDDAAPPLDPRAMHPYRPTSPAAAAGAVTRGRISTRATLATLLGCMVFTALALPFALHFPRWIELEGVLTAWWLAWAVVLGVLAYRGRPLDASMDLAVRAPWEGAASEASSGPEVPSRFRLRWADVFDVASVDGEGCLFALALMVVVAIAFVAAFFVVELVAPVVFFVAYVGVARAMRRALTAGHRGSAGASAAHGVVWASLYVMPLMAVVAAAHYIAMR